MLLNSSSVCEQTIRIPPASDSIKHACYRRRSPLCGPAEERPGLLVPKSRPDPADDASVWDASPTAHPARAPWHEKSAGGMSHEDSFQGTLPSSGGVSCLAAATRRRSCGRCDARRGRPKPDETHDRENLLQPYRLPSDAVAQSRELAKQETEMRSWADHGCR
jgi:hypothetical protein